MRATSAFENIERVRDYFGGKEVFRLVIVYGSAARGRFLPSSDVDIAVAGTNVLDKHVLATAQSELSLVLGRPVDLIDLNRVEGLILHRAIARGVRIKTDPTLFVKFHTKALTWREDFQPLQRLMRDARIRRFIDGS